MGILNIFVCVCAHVCERNREYECSLFYIILVVYRGSNLNVGITLNTRVSFVTTNGIKVEKSDKYSLFFLL